MALIKGAIDFGSNFNIGAKGPIDARQRVETIEDLTTVWTADIPAYKGMVVSVLEDNSIYILKADDATVFGNWKKIGDVSGDITNLQGQITANKDKIDIINGTGDGSITKAVLDAKTELIGDAATADTIKHAEQLAIDASTKVDTKIAEEVERANAAYATAAQGATADSAIQSVAAKTGDKYITATPNGTSVEIASKGIDSAIKTAADAVKVSVNGGGYITGSTDAAGRVITLGSTTQTIAEANSTAKGLAEASDVKSYVDGKVSEINTAAGELGTRVTTLEDKVGDETKGLVKGLADAKTAIDTINGDGNGSITKAVSDAKTELIGTEGTAGATIYGAKKDAADAKAAADAKISAVTSKAGDKYVKATTDGTAVTIESIGIDGAISDAKTELIGTDKDSATVDTINGAKAAAKAADDKAAAAQTAANSKIKSVTGNTTVIATTTDHAVSVSLKTSDKGNVKFTQDTDGLSANVTIPEATVTGVKADDKFLSLADKLVSADVSIAYDAADKKIYLYGKDKNKANAVSSIDCTDFIKDGMLTDAELVTNPEGQDAGTYIKLTWNTDGGKQPMYINVTSLIDIYTAKPDGGLVLEDHAFSVDTTKIATVESVNGVTSRVSTLEGKVATIEGEGEGSIKKAVADEASRAKAAEEANATAIAAETTRAMEAEAALIGTDADAATKDTIKGAKKAVKDLKDQIEKDAVTLTIPDTDPYITASKDATTNKYTIKSKLDADGTTPLVDVKINTKLTELNGGGTSTAANGISITVTETAGRISTPAVTVTPGSVAAGNASVVTGGAVYTAVDDAKSALIGTDADTKDSNTIKGAKKYTDDALVWHDIA